MRRSILWIVALVLILAAGGWLYQAFKPSVSRPPLRVALSPYQDLAMIVNVEPLGLEKKYGTDIELITLPWESIPAAVASAGSGADVGFGSYAEYLSKYENLNKGSNDPVLFIFPLYVFKGGGFVSFRDDVPTLTKEQIGNAADPAVRRILSLKLGAQRASVYEMMLYDLALRHGVDPKSLKIFDTPLDRGFLAAEQGSLDISEAGLTQLTEVKRRGGHLVFNMEDQGFADITGFIVKKSVYDSRRADIENLIKMWFDCVNYVYSDMRANSGASLAYLNRTASTHYTLPEYQSALAQEYLPRTVGEARAAMIAPDGRFSSLRIGGSMNAFLVARGLVRTAAPLPAFPASP